LQAHLKATHAEAQRKAIKRACKEKTLKPKAFKLVMSCQFLKNTSYNTNIMPDGSFFSQINHI